MPENNKQAFQGIWELAMEILKEDLPRSGEVRIVNTPEFCRLEVMREIPKAPPERALISKSTA